MAGFFDKMLDAMKLGDDDYDDYEDEFEDYEDEEDEEPKKSFFRRNKDSEDEEEITPPKEKANKTASKITPMRSSRRGNSGSMEVCVVKPTSFDDSKEILETLIAGKTVVLNIEGLDLGLAQRIIDVTSGACYAIDGTLQKVSNYIFLIVPSNVDISGDFASMLMDTMDFSGLQSGI